VESDAPYAGTVQAIFAHLWEQLTSYERVKRAEFYELPKTISGKIR